MYWGICYGRRGGRGGRRRRTGGRRDKQRSGGGRRIVRKQGIGGVGGLSKYGRAEGEGRRLGEGH